MADHYAQLLAALGAEPPRAPVSPEASGTWACPACDNTTAFEGRWVGGVTGRTIAQHVDVGEPQWQGHDGVVYLDCRYVDTGEEVPGSVPERYAAIHCRACAAVVWAGEAVWNAYQEDHG